MDVRKPETSADRMNACDHCGMLHDVRTCPRISAIEYHPDGVSIRRIEYHPPQPIEIGSLKGVLPEIPK